MHSKVGRPVSRVLLENGRRPPAALDLARPATAAFQTFRYKPHPPMQVHGDTLKTMGTAMVSEVIGRMCWVPPPRRRTRRRVGGHRRHHDHLGWGDENSLGAVLPRRSAMTRGPMTMRAWPWCGIGVSACCKVLDGCTLVDGQLQGVEEDWGSNHYTNEATADSTTSIG